MTSPMSAPSEEDLIDAIETAAERAISALFREHAEHFYYCSLITSGEAHPPVLSAWSEEALDREAAKGDETRHHLRWSYVKSPYFCYGEEDFGEVRRLFAERPPMDCNGDIQWMEEYNFRLGCMEEAMKRLDKRGLFGEGEKRKNIVINVEVMPPDYTNTERAIRLNPRESLTEWPADVAEEPDDLIRLNLEDCDKAFIHGALTACLEKAANYGRALIEIRMSRMMLDKLQIERGRNGAFFKGVLVRVCNTGFDETVEVIFGPMPRQH